MSVRIAEIVRGAGLISRQELDKALEFSERDGTPFALYLLSNNIIAEKDLMPVLARGLGVELFDLDSFDPDPQLIVLIAPEIAFEYRVIPLERVGNNLIVAGGDPTNLGLIDKLSTRLGIRVRVKLASELAIQRGLTRFFGGNRVDDRRGTRIAATDPGAGNEESYAVSFVTRLLQTAVQRKASDIHIEPFERMMRVRLRQDGSLIEYQIRPKIQMRDAIIARIKIVSNLDIAEKRLPQDGATKLDVPGFGKIDFRVSTIPTVFGEKVVMRLLDKSNLQLDLTKLGFETEQLEVFLNSIHRPFGMVVVTGPTGSGKTTTLYSALNELNRVSDCVLTAEDPVEYQIPGICQVQMKPDIGLTFAATLRAFLRQDPDVILVGEIRDGETAEIALNAALTGHIVLSTLHTNNAAETFERLLYMNVEPSTLIAAVNAVVAQRLIRVICPQCKIIDEAVTPEEMVHHGLPEKYAHKMKVYKGAGCDSCNHTGYKGRAAIYEVLPMTDSIKMGIVKKLSSIELKKIAMKDGMQTLRQSCWKKIARGVTSLEQLMENSSPDKDNKGK